jgi:parallel beta-helix repeat protein
MLGMKKWKLLTVVLIVGVLWIGIMPSHFFKNTLIFFNRLSITDDKKQEIPNNENITTHDTYNISNIGSPKPNTPTPRPTPKPTPTPTQTSRLIYNQEPVTYTNNYLYTPTPTPASTLTPSDNSKEIQSAINALGPAGGDIVLQSDATLSSADVQVTSNIVFSGANPNITLHLDSKRLNVARNAVNVTIKSLVIDAYNIGGRNAFWVDAGAQNISIQNVTIQNQLTTWNSLIILGNYVEIRNINFVNVSASYPIQVSGSHSIVKNCRSSDQSSYALVTITGGITDVRIEENLAENRPLLAGGYTKVSSSDIWVVNNTLLNFPRRTYGILVNGGTDEPLKAPFDKVFILGNIVKAGNAAYNGIAIYGLSRNVIVANNTVDQTLSAHNGIGVASGINVTVTQNTVFGCAEGAEGGIEVESNPIHNSFTGISENVNVTKNIVYGSQWGIYVRIMVPDHPNWIGNPLKSKNILIEGNIVSKCTVGINLLHGDSIIVRDNNIVNNTKPLVVDKLNTINVTISNNVGCLDYSL